MDPRSLQLLLVVVITCLQECTSEIMHCVSDQDCPANGFCFKDECSRCLCTSGHQVANFYNDGTLTKICRRKKPDIGKQVGDPCSPEVGGVTCPYGSACASDDTCACAQGLVASEDGLHCRRPLFGELCEATSPCEETFGFECKQDTERCACRNDHHQPTPWTNFVLSRWNYTRVEGGPQDCVVRAVGEPCEADSACAAVQGSGAVCSACGYCQCRIHGHVPNILGTKCGRALSYNARCSLHGRRVCDGSLGLQCGDVCDLYEYNTRQKRHCTCSQMHDRLNDACTPKTTGSKCSTDLDCYLLTQGFGYCEDGLCQFNAADSRDAYEPHFVNRTCADKLISGRKPPIGRHLNHNPTNSSTYLTSGDHLQGSPSTELLATPRTITIPPYMNNDSKIFDQDVDIFNDSSRQAAISSCSKNSCTYLYIVAATIGLYELDQALRSIASKE